MDLLPITDDALLARLAQGDAAALETLYDKYVRQCFGLALKILGDPALSEEVVQEVFLKLWTRPSSYSSHKGKFISWLLSVVHHRCIDELRRRSRTEVALETPDGGNLLSTEADPAAGPGEQVLVAEQQRVVRRALQDIPDAQREVLELAYYRGLSQTEIADKLGQPLGTVKTRMRSGLQRLRAVIEPLGLRSD